MSHLRLREDLAAETVTDGTRTFIDVFDPFTGEGYRFFEQEYAVACGLDGSRDIEGVVRWAHDELGLKTSHDEVEAVIAALDNLGYLTRALPRPTEAELAARPAAKAPAMAPAAAALVEPTQVSAQAFREELPAAHRATPVQVSQPAPTRAPSEPSRPTARAVPAEPLPPSKRPPSAEPARPTPALSMETLTTARVPVDMPETRMAETRVDARAYDELSGGVVAPKRTPSIPTAATDLELGRPGASMSPAETPRSTHDFELGAPGHSAHQMDEMAAATRVVDPPRAQAPAPTARDVAPSRPVAAPKPAPVAPSPRTPAPSPAPVRAAPKPSRPPAPAPQPSRRGTSKWLVGTFLVVAIGGVSYTLKKFVFTPTPAPEPVQPLRKPTPAPNVAPPPTTKLSLVQGPEMEVQTPKAGTVLSIEVEGPVQTGTRLLRFVGADELDKTLAELDQQITVHIPEAIAQATATRDGLLAKSNGVENKATEKAAASIATLQVQLTEATTKRDAARAELIQVELSAPSSGTFRPKAAVGAVVAEKDVIGTLTPPAMLAGKLKVGKVAEELGQTVNITGGGKTLACKVQAVEQGDATLECNFIEGTDGIDFSWTP